MTKFVNPYTFVPLSGEPERRKPTGHDTMPAGHLSGIIDFTLTTLTPLLLGGYESDIPRRHDGQAMIPGSGMLGAVRSLHEALTGSCLRVFNADWAPVHRHPASTAETSGLRMAMVTRVDATGRPAAAVVCGEGDVFWVDQRLLPRRGGRMPQTGDRLKVPWGKAFDSGSNRRLLRPQDVAPDEIEHLGELEPGADLAESGLLLVTDTGARAKDKPVYFAVGRIGTDTPSCAVSAQAWDTYKQTVDGANDLRPAVMGQRDEPEYGSMPPEYAEVRWPVTNADDTAGPVIARRLRARHHLYPGQPIWVRLADREITEIRLSQLWRYQGDYSAGERAGGAVACKDPAQLCWSCRLFGSADTAGRADNDISRQKSYRGHVRIDDLLAEEAFTPQEWHLAPLEAPKPSAGQFYLDNANRQRPAAKDTRPAATWGSCADDGSAHGRQIRGRKFYWRTAAPEAGQYPRGKYRDHAESQSREVLLIPAGKVFKGRLRFENLSEADYGSLLAALDPRLLADLAPGGWDQTVTSLGGGKPFGFGAVRIDLCDTRAQTAAGRYLGLPETAPETAPATAVAAFRAGVKQPVLATWPALRNALTLGFVPDDLVWYPPGAGAKGTQDFDRSFEFFARTNGLKLSRKVRDLISLPSAAKPAAEQALDSQAGERPLEDADNQARRNGGRR
ncbi:MAG TPA: RAMP superfamily CRISPR-associated protein [Streptosporangiaceae bacterium]|nr:RAMP superfamily CRISPR-associated protein [Streptosporangiaceae bacterium]